MFFNTIFNFSPKEEAQHSFYKYEYNSFSESDSLLGRVVCLLLIPCHGVAIFYKPFHYTTRAVIECVKGVFYALKTVVLFVCWQETKAARYETKENFIDAFHSIGCALVSPFGQAVQALKALFGIIFPWAYFKKESVIGNNYANIINDINDVFQFECNFNDPNNKPHELLHRLVEEIANNPDKALIKVKYFDQKGEDSGALSRDLIQRLTKGVKKSLFVNFNIDLGKEIPDWDPDWEEPVDGVNAIEVLEDLGKLLAFVSIQRGDTAYSCYSIGDIFHKDYYKGLFAFKVDHINEKDFENIPLKDLIDARIAITQNIDVFNNLNQLKKFLEWHPAVDLKNQKKHIDFITNIYNLAGAEVPKNIEDDLDQIKEFVSGELEGLIKSKLKVLHTLAKGFGNYTITFEQHQAYPNIAARFIQGEFSKKRLLSLVCFQDISNQRKKRILKWLNSKNEDELKNFLFYANASQCTAPIIFRQVKDGNVKAHSCTGIVDIPKKMLDVNIFEILNFCCIPGDVHFSEK